MSTPASTPPPVSAPPSDPAPPSPAAPLSPTAEAELRDIALRRLKKRRDFHTHVVVYIVVNGFLWALWAVFSITSGWTFPWPVFPLLGWGIGLALNAWDVYGRREITIADVDREAEKLRNWVAPPWG